MVVFRPKMRFALIALLGLLALPAAAAARSSSCMVPGKDATCDLLRGKVTMVGDGDTIYVDVWGDRTRRSVPVRLTGVNAMEQTVYSSRASRRRGECHALEATARLEQLIEKGRRRVRLLAMDAESRSGRRLRRVVAVKFRGRWRDAGRRLVAEGHALWLPNGREHLWNRDYSVLAERAARLGRGIWNPAACAPGPSDDHPLQLWVNSDADGRDRDNPNGEWVKVRNLDPARALPLGGWWVRDSGLRRYTFPSWVTLAPGETITVRVGEGPDAWPELFWGRRRGVFNNATDNVKAMGDGAYLFDPDGDLRAHMQYPCRTECADPNVGAIAIGAKPRGREHITLRNVAAHAVDLEQYRLAVRRFAYTFSPGSVLAPGETLRIDVRGDPAADTRLHRHWGETGPILRNRGGRIRLASFRQIEIACHGYGDRAC